MLCNIILWQYKIPFLRKYLHQARKLLEWLEWEKPKTESKERSFRSGNLWLVIQEISFIMSFKHFSLSHLTRISQSTIDMGIQRERSLLIVKRLKSDVYRGRVRDGTLFGFSEELFLSRGAFKIHILKSIRLVIPLLTSTRVGGLPRQRRRELQAKAWVTLFMYEGTLGEILNFPFHRSGFRHKN